MNLKITYVLINSWFLILPIYSQIISVNGGFEYFEESQEIDGYRKLDSILGWKELNLQEMKWSVDIWNDSVPNRRLQNISTVKIKTFQGSSTLGFGAIDPNDGDPNYEIFSTKLKTKMEAGGV